MIGGLFKTSGEPMGNTQLGITVASLLCSILGIMLIMKMPMKSPPLLVACAVSCCCSSSQSATLVNDVQKRMKSESESE